MTRANVMRRPRTARLGRTRPWWILPVAAGVVAAAVLWPHDDRTPPQPAPHQALTEVQRVRLAAPTGPRTVKEDLCMVEVIDQSSSMADADPHSLRATAVGAVADWLGRYGQPGDRLGVVWFADTTLTFPPVPARGDPASLQVAAQDPGSSVGGSTNMVKALEDAAALLRTCPSGSRPSMVIISDGVVDATTPLRELLDQAPSGTRVHLVAMDVDGAYSAGAYQLWESPAVGLASVQRVAAVDAKGVTDPAAFILGQETGQHVEQA